MILKINFLSACQFFSLLMLKLIVLYFFHAFLVMSSQDSVSTVYKCMLRGAADYLVKPIRINELRNLWQHVWRRQSVGLLLSQFSVRFQFFS